MAFRCAVVLIVVALTLLEVQARKIPSYVKLCKTSNPDFDSCLTDTVESLRPRLTKGIPKMHVPPIEPFVLPSLEVNRDLEAIKVRAHLMNIVAHGPSDFIINRLKTDVDKLMLELSITFPHIGVTADYDVDGRVLVAPFRGKGAFKGNFTDVKVDVRGNGKVITKDGEEFLEIDKVRTKIRVGDSNVKVNNRDDRHGALAQSAAQFYNQNKKQILDILLPIVQDTAEEIIKQLGDRILQSAPLNEILPA